jgi:hypothetical protein
LLWLIFLIFLYLLALAIWLGRGMPCIFCELFKKRRYPEFGRDRKPAHEGCLRVPRDIYKRPDPLIYSQSFLMKQGLAVTWDNPDIWLEQNGVAVPSSALSPDTDYDVVARIWNGSNEAPAINMRVDFSYLSFGIGTTSTSIGSTFVDLPVKGAADCPAFTKIKWRTPIVAGHYCLQVRLIWPDDAEPDNNLGQENTNVKPLNSPHAAFTFPVRNDLGTTRLLRLTADAYRLAPPGPCDEPRPGQTPTLSAEEAAALRRRALVRHGRQQFPLPPGWTVLLQPQELQLEPGAEQLVTVDITAPAAFAGRQTLNINAFDDARLVGGVTLYVEGS